MPIDIASGAVHSTYRDILIPGRIPLSWSRTYNTALLSQPESPFGSGWTSPVFAKLTRIGADYRFRSPSGAEIVFPDPQDTIQREGLVRDLGSSHEISRRGVLLRVTHWNASGLLTCYFFQPARNGEWWPLRSIEDASGDGLELAWDEHGLLKGVRQKTEKRTLAIAHTPAGRIATVSFRLPDGRMQILVRYDYDSKGRLSLAQDAKGFTDRFEYDSAGRLTREIAKDGGVFAYKYDDQGRCIRSSGVGNYDLKILRYLDNVNWTEVTDSQGRKHIYERSPSGQILMHLDPLGAKTETAYDEHGRVIVKTDPLGGKTVFEYDGEGNRVKVVDALGNESITEYNANHQVAIQFDPAGGQWERKYDAANRPIAAIDPLGNTSAIEYDPMGNPIRVKNADGSSALRKFSNIGDLLEESDFNGVKTTYVRDPFGRIEKRIEADGKTTSYQYDLLGQVTQVAYDSGKVVSYDYDAAGNIVRISSSTSKPITYAFGPCRRLVSKTYGAGQTVKYAWGTEPDMLESVTNELGETYRFKYDACDRIIAETGFDGRTTRFKFDLAGRCIGRANNLGESIEWNLDAIGRIVGESVPGQATSAFEYDKNGNLAKASNGWSTLEFERDALGRITQEAQNGFRLNRSYGRGAAVLRLESDAGIVFGYTYDAEGCVKTVDADGLGTFSFSRNSRGKVEEMGIPGGSRLKQRFDTRDRILQQAFTGPEGSETSAGITREYAYGETDSLQAISDSQWGKTRYTHDESRRLIQSVSDGTRLDFELNACGDPMAIVENGSIETRRSYTAGGVLENQGPIRYKYDGAGRLIAKTDDRGQDPSRAWRYAWDAKNRLLSVTTPKGETWEYAYDPLGRRCAKKGPGREIRFIWDQDVLLHEIEDGKETRTWGFEPYGFKPLFRIQNRQLHTILRDHLGTPREMADAGGRIVWSVLFDPWGNPLKSKGDLAECPLRFQGQYFDEESGLHYNRYRYYDPQSGRFISQDPIRLDGGLSAYQYVPNPLHWIDPFGLCGDEEDGGGEPDVLYRAMKDKHYARFLKTGKVPATGETFTSPTEAESQGYRGVLVKFTLKPGTIGKLEAIGVRDATQPLTAAQYPEMPLLQDTRNWTQNNAFFKEENNQVNIGLGKGKGLDTFNDNITGHEVVPRK
jgi:RHS repeat-associated protein